MNRYFLSRRFRVHLQAQGNTVPFCLQQLAAADTALCSPLLTTDHLHLQPLSHHQAEKIGCIASTAGGIGSFKSHKRPPPQRLPSCRCI